MMPNGHLRSVVAVVELTGGWPSQPWVPHSFALFANEWDLVVNRPAYLPVLREDRTEALRNQQARRCWPARNDLSKYQDRLPTS